MTTRIKILKFRLVERIKSQPDYAKKIGVSMVLPVIESKKNGTWNKQELLADK